MKYLHYRLQKLLLIFHLNANRIWHADKNCCIVLYVTTILRCSKLLRLAINLYLVLNYLLIVKYLLPINTIYNVKSTALIPQKMHSWKQSSINHWNSAIVRLMGVFTLYNFRLARFALIRRRNKSKIYRIIRIAFSRDLMVSIFVLFFAVINFLPQQL